jgi:hypothetical protein
MSPSLYLTDIQIEKRKDSIAFELNAADDGWLMRRDVDGLRRRMCWLPHNRRNGGEVLACDRQRVVIGAMGGLLTFLDLSNI